LIYRVSVKLGRDWTSITVNVGSPSCMYLVLLFFLINLTVDEIHRRPSGVYPRPGRGHIGRKRNVRDAVFEPILINWKATMLVNSF